MRYLLAGLMIAALGACASGSSIVVGDARAPTAPEDVRLYLEPPTREYEVIAIVKAESDTGFTQQQSVNYAVAELKKQAARVGANGILITGQGQKPTGGFIDPNTGIYVASEAEVIEGRALFVY